MLTRNPNSCGGTLVECAQREPPPAQISPPNLPRAAAPGQTIRPCHRRPKKAEKVLAARRQRRRIGKNEPDAKAILPEPRSVKKVISYQSSLSTANKISIWRQLDSDRFLFLKVMYSQG